MHAPNDALAIVFAPVALLTSHPAALLTHGRVINFRHGRLINSRSIISFFRIVFLYFFLFWVRACGYGLW